MKMPFQWNEIVRIRRNVPELKEDVEGSEGVVCGFDDPAAPFTVGVFVIKLGAVVSFAIGDLEGSGKIAPQGYVPPPTRVQAKVLEHFRKQREQESKSVVAGRPADAQQLLENIRRMEKQDIALFCIRWCRLIAADIRLHYNENNYEAAVTLRNCNELTHDLLMEAEACLRGERSKEETMDWVERNIKYYSGIDGSTIFASAVAAVTSAQ